MAFANFLNSGTTSMAQLFDFFIVGLYCGFGILSVIYPRFLGHLIVCKRLALSPLVSSSYSKFSRVPVR